MHRIQLIGNRLTVYAGYPAATSDEENPTGILQQNNVRTHTHTHKQYGQFGQTLVCPNCPYLINTHLDLFVTQIYFQRSIFEINPAPV